MARARAILIWLALAAAIAVPLAVAGLSPLLAWRDPVYIVAGFAGVVAMALLLVQPLLAGGHLPGLGPRRGRRAHRVVGVVLLGAVLVHVGGLWITSPPDMIDALLLVAPTPFSYLGVLAMWALFAAALLAAFRRRIRPRVWRRAHVAAAAVVVAASVGHAMLIEGTMGTISKAALCALAVAATVKVIADLRLSAPRPRRGA